MWAGKRSGSQPGHMEDWSAPESGSSLFLSHHIDVIVTLLPLFPGAPNKSWTRRALNPILFWKLALLHLLHFNKSFTGALG